MIFIALHMGLGDAIACAAIVAKLAQSGEDIIVPCWEHNKTSVKSLFVNLENVQVVTDKEIGSIEGFGIKKLNLGVYNKDLPQLPEEDFVEWFYRGAGMTLEDKEEFCPIKEAVKSIEQLKIRRSKPVLNFLHEDKKRKFIINREGIAFDRTFEPINVTESILKYAEIMENCEMIHCIDSSFLHLSEALSVPGKKVYHKDARPGSTDYKYLKGWEVLS